MNPKSENEYQFNVYLYLDPCKNTWHSVINTFHGIFGLN